MWELKNKKTNKPFIVDDEVYEELRGNGQIKKFVATKIEKPVVKKVIPEEIIQKKSVSVKSKNEQQK